MPNANKTVKGLECCLRMISSDVSCKEMECPYYSKHDQARLVCWTDLNRDAINLIRNAYKREVDPKAKDKTHWYCGKCGCRLPLKIKPKFCHKCGMKIGQWIFSEEVKANENGS